jgi:hypothetical protein
MRKSVSSPRGSSDVFASAYPDMAQNLLFCSTAVQLIPQAYDLTLLKTDRWLT